MPRIGADQVDTPASRQLALRAAQESMVLLKNAHDTLPLHAGMRLAVIGPNADTLETLEANYHGTARAPVTPLQALRARFGAKRVSYAQGAPIAAGVPIPIPETALRDGHGQVGLTGSYFDRTDFSGTPDTVRTDRRIDFDWDHVAPAAGHAGGSLCGALDRAVAAAGPRRLHLAVQVDRCFDCAGHDPVRLFVDGKLVVDDNAATATHLQVADAFHRYAAARRSGWSWCTAARTRVSGCSGWRRPRRSWRRSQAAVQQADAVIAFVGLSPDVEGEELQIDLPGFDGGDRTRLDLPAAQRALLERAAASGKPLVVVLMSGSAVALNWSEATRRRDPGGVVSGRAGRHRHRAGTGRRQQPGRAPAGDLLPHHARPAALRQLRDEGTYLSLFHRHAAVSVRLWAQLHALRLCQADAVVLATGGRPAAHGRRRCAQRR